jgi:hypothetical protein
MFLVQYSYNGTMWEDCVGVGSDRSGRRVYSNTDDAFDWTDWIRRQWPAVHYRVVDTEQNAVICTFKAGERINKVNWILEGF